MALKDKLKTIKMKILKRIKKIFNEVIKIYKSLLKWFENKESIATWILAVVTLASVLISYKSFKETLKISKKQLEQSERLYELQNRPMVLIKNGGWYPIKVLSGDVGLRIRMRVFNFGKSPTNKAKIIKDIAIRIRTDILNTKKFPLFINDVTKISEEVDVEKDKRIVEQYLPYREKPIKDIIKYIVEKKGIVTSDDIINHFSADYKEKGYEFIPYSDLQYNDYMIIPPNLIGEIKETGRSISVPGFESEILKEGGDILLFYYAIEYKGPLETKKYITHYIGYYDSLQKVRQKDNDNIHLFTGKYFFFDEIEQ